MISLVYNNNHLASLISKEPLNHIKFIKLEIINSNECIRETVELSFSRPKNTLLIDFIDFSNQLMIIILEQNRIPSDIVITNNEERQERHNDTHKMPKTQTPEEENFTEKFSETVGIFKNLFKCNKNDNEKMEQNGQNDQSEQRQLKIENNSKLHDSTLTWKIRKK
jgi:hypothetical protein